VTVHSNIGARFTGGQEVSKGKEREGEGETGKVSKKKRKGIITQ
jgi:hypothetical protein